MNYINLDLPSKILWAQENENGYYTYDAAIDKFKNNLPTIDNFFELFNYCAYKWDNSNKGFIFSNNNQNLFLPANGIFINSNIINVGTIGTYWILPPHQSFNNNSLSFNNKNYSIANNNLNYGLSVRTIKHSLNSTI